MKGFLTEEQARAEGLEALTYHYRIPEELRILKVCVDALQAGLIDHALVKTETKKGSVRVSVWAKPKDTTRGLPDVEPDKQYLWDFLRTQPKQKHADQCIQYAQF